MGWIPLAIAAAGQLGGALLGGSNRQQDTRDANALNQNQFDLELYQLLSQIEPELGRQQQLDPVRNATIGSLLTEFFPNIDPSVAATITSAGPRPGLRTPPKFQGLQVPSLGRAALSEGLPGAVDLAAAIAGRNDNPGAAPIPVRRFDEGELRPNPPQQLQPFPKPAPPMRRTALPPLTGVVR